MYHSTPSESKDLMQPCSPSGIAMSRKGINYVPWNTRGSIIIPLLEVTPLLIPSVRPDVTLLPRDNLSGCPLDPAPVRPRRVISRPPRAPLEFELVSSDCSDGRRRCLIAPRMMAPNFHISCEHRELRKTRLKGGENCDAWFGDATV